MQRREIHAQLEKEMQERLAERIAAKMHEERIAMEAQIREEIKAEYHTDWDPEVIYDDGEYNELEGRIILDELLQVEEDREQWRSEREAVRTMLSNSKAEFDEVCKGLKKKIDKEKSRSRDLEEANQDKEIVIERLAEEYQGVMSQCRELQQQIYDDEESSHHSQKRPKQRWEEKKAGLVKDHQIQLEEMFRREEQYATQIGDLQNEVNELLEEQTGERTSHENEYHAWEDEKELLVHKADEKEDESRKAMDYVKWLNSKNNDYLVAIEGYKGKFESMRDEANQLEESRVKFSVLQIEQKELKQDYEECKGENENLMRQAEHLAAENGDCRLRIQTLERDAGDASADLSYTREEHDELRDSLRETTEACLEMKSRLSSCKRDKDQAQEQYEDRVQHLEKLLDEADAALVTVGRAITTEKEKAVEEMESISRHRELVAGLQKFDASATENDGEALTRRVAGLNSVVESLTAERDAANARVTEVMSGTDMVLASLSASVDEKKKTIAGLAAGKRDAIAEARGLEDAVKEAKDEAEILTFELHEATFEINNLTAQVDAANRRRSEVDATDNATKNGAPGSNRSPDGEKKQAGASSTAQKDELRRVANYLEQLQSESSVHEYEGSVEVLKIAADEFEDSWVKLNALQIEHKELMRESETKEEQNENLTRQTEQLNFENGDLQRQIQNLERDVDEVSAHLSSTREERNELQDSLRETAEMCSETESRLASYKREKEQTLEEYEGKIRNLEKLFEEADASSVSVEQAITTEKENAMADVESRHREVVAGLKKHVSRSKSTVLKLVGQLSAVAGEKARVASDLSAMKDKSEALTKQIMRLESSVESLNAERDAANARATKLTSSKESMEQVLSSLAAGADESKETIAGLVAERWGATAKERGMEATVKELQAEAGNLSLELSVSTSEIDKLKAQIEAANQQRTEGETKNNAMDKSVLGSNSSTTQNSSTHEDRKIKTKTAQFNIDDMKGTRAQHTIGNTTIPAKNIVSAKSQNDIQVEKEDLEIKNEISMKLAGLTTKSLEEAIADQRIEYKGSTAGFESQLAELREDDDEDVSKSSPETIGILKRDTIIDQMQGLFLRLDATQHNPTDGVDDQIQSLKSRMDFETLDLLCKYT